jgi:hypothetical protein
MPSIFYRIRRLILHPVEGSSLINRWATESSRLAACYGDTTDNTAPPNTNTGNGGDRAFSHFNNSTAPAVLKCRDRRV